MANPVLILHGWSDTAASFKPIKEWLVASGRNAQEVFFGNYASMADDVSFDDLADGLQTRLAALESQGALRLDPFSLDVIVHSTGGPVIRHWLHHYLYNVHGGDLARCPIARLIMLAPANFGSRLAAQGKSTLAKLFKGGVGNGFQTGRRILEGLELGSPVLWTMADNDLFRSPSCYPIGDRGPWVFVLSGTATYGDLKGLVARGANEDGSDGTVRAAAASLNSVRFSVDYTNHTKPDDQRVSCARPLSQPVAFRLVEGVNHSEIVPDSATAASATFPLLRKCLGVQTAAEYVTVCDEFERDNNDFYDRQAGIGPVGADGRVHAYQQFVVRVKDDMGNAVQDYRFDFHVVDGRATRSSWDARNTADPTLAMLRQYQPFTEELQQHVIADVKPHSVDPCFRTFFVNLDRLDALRAKLPAGAFIGLSLDAAGPTEDLTYATDGLRYLRVVIPLKDQKGKDVAFFARNTSTLVDVKVERVPSPGVFDVTTVAPG